MIFRRPVSTTARFLAAMRRFVDGCPGSALGFVRRYAAVLVAFLDVVGLSFLFVGVLRFITAWHCDTLRRETPLINAESVPEPTDGSERTVADIRWPIPEVRGPTETSDIGDRLSASGHRRPPFFRRPENNAI